nr:hypothetical protein Iba_chr03aCG8990 [Ipomoea batatas]
MTATTLITQKYLASAISTVGVDAGGTSLATRQTTKGMTASLSKNLAGSSANRAEQRSQINNEEDIPRFADSQGRAGGGSVGCIWLRRRPWSLASSSTVGCSVTLLWFKTESIFKTKVFLLLCYWSLTEETKKQVR